MHNDLKFTQPDSPARSICELIDYIGELSQICSERTFVYRGQINEYSSSIFPDTKFPLLPSKFRPLIDANFLPRNIDNAPLPLGNKYYCVYPVETFGDTVAHRISTGGHRLPLPVKVGIDASHPLVKGILILSDVVFDSERLFDGLRGYAAQHIDFGSDLAITLDNALRETFWQMKEVLADSKYKDSIEDHATPLHEVVDLIHKQAFVYCINDGLYPHAYPVNSGRLVW